MSFVNFSMSQTPWDVLDFSNQSAQAAGAPQACCRPTAHPLYIHFRYVIMDVIPNFAIPKMQWDGLEISNHPVQATCLLQAHCRLTAHLWYIYFSYVDMDVNYKFFILRNSIVWHTIIKPVRVSCRCAAGMLQADCTPFLNTFLVFQYGFYFLISQSHRHSGMG